MKRLIRSSKFWAVVIGIIGVILTHLVGLSPEQVESANALIVTLIGIFVCGTVAEDVAAKLKKKK